MAEQLVFESEEMAVYVGGPTAIRVENKANGLSANLEAYMDTILFLCNNGDMHLITMSGNPVVQCFESKPPTFGDE